MGRLARQSRHRPLRMRLGVRPYNNSLACFRTVGVQVLTTKETMEGMIRLEPIIRAELRDACLGTLINRFGLTTLQPLFVPDSAVVGLAAISALVRAVGCLLPQHDGWFLGSPHVVECRHERGIGITPFSRSLHKRRFIDRVTRRGCHLASQPSAHPSGGVSERCTEYSVDGMVSSKSSGSWAIA